MLSTAIKRIKIKNMLLDGLHIPATTPFYSDGRVYLRKLEHNVARYSMTPAAGIAILAGPCEAEMLDDTETRDVLAAAVGAAAPEKVLWAGVGRPSVAATLDLIHYAAGLGYDVALVRVPAVGASVYFGAVADASELPVVIFDPESALDPEEVSHLSLHARIFGIVSGAGNIAAVIAASAKAPRRDVVVTPVFSAVTGRMQATQSREAATFVSAGSLADGGAAIAVAPPKPALKTRTRNVGFQVLSSSDAGMVDALASGAQGLLTTFTASAPQACHEVYAAWKDGDPKLAAEKQARIAAPAAEIVEGLGIAGVKYAAELTGYYGGKPRLPRLPLTADQRAEVERRMYGIRS